MVKGARETMVLGLCAARCVGNLRLSQKRREVESPGLPVIERGLRLEQIRAADDLIERAQSELGEDLAHLLRYEEEEPHRMLGQAREALSQLRILRGDADRTGVEVAHAHENAAQGDQRRRREAELVRSE